MTDRADGNAPPSTVHSGMSQRRLRRRRSPPRIISLTEGVGTDIPMKNIKSMKPVPRITPKLPKDIGRIPRPVLLNTVRYRPEKRTELPPSTRTSVQTLAESKTVPKIRVPRVRNRLPRGAQFRPDVASARIPALSQIESIANDTQQSSASMKQKTSAIRGSGLSLASGETHLWKLTNKGVPRSNDTNEGNLPKLLVNGNQGVRISFMSMSGDILQDIEIPPKSQPAQLPAPPGTRLVAATGLGGAGTYPEHIEMGAGGILTEMSTNNRAGVGFHPTSKLTQLGPQTYLCRGAHLRLKTIYSGAARSDRQFFTAMNVLSQQSEVKFTLPSTVDNLVIVLSGMGDGNEALSVDLGGLQVNGSPDLIKRQGTIAYVWDVSDEINKQSLAQITATMGKGWVITSIAGVKGPYENWLAELKNGKWNGLVEEGPLTANGHSNLRWIQGTPRVASRESFDRTISGKIPKREQYVAKGAVDVKIPNKNPKNTKKASSRRSSKKSRK